MNLPKRRILVQDLNKIGHGGYRLGYQAGMGHGMQVRHCELDNCGAGWESQRVGQAASDRLCFCVDTVGKEGGGPKGSA